jgi:hypothetical protein
MSSSYPTLAGYRKQSTSKEAADDINIKLPHLRDKVLQIIKNKGKYGATPEEVASLLNITILSVRPRFTELKLSNHIVDTGEKRKNGFNKNIIVWRYNDERKSESE